MKKYIHIIYNGVHLISFNSHLTFNRLLNQIVTQYHCCKTKMIKVIKAVRIKGAIIFKTQKHFLA